MDNLIIGTAMAELTSFPSIPVKVTLDEYIEIEILLDARQQHLHQRRAEQDRRFAHRRRPHQESGPRPDLRPDAACLFVAALAAALAACGARQVKTERKGRIITTTRFSTREVRTPCVSTPAFGRNRPAASVAGQRDERTGRHRQIRPQLRMHDARI